MTAGIRQPDQRPLWKQIAMAQKAKAHINLRRAVTAERELRAIERRLRFVPGIVVLFFELVRGGA